MPKPSRAFSDINNINPELSLSPFHSKMSTLISKSFQPLSPLKNQKWKMENSCFGTSIPLLIYFGDIDIPRLQENINGAMIRLCGKQNIRKLNNLCVHRENSYSGFSSITFLAGNRLNLTVLAGN